MLIDVVEALFGGKVEELVDAAEESDGGAAEAFEEVYEAAAGFAGVV
ncbi:hypothetical protein AGMMS50233_06900 [Endomicrobiia bacterium]|nr:hypothetical protein AGMMS50233_06900 [Endomicrobiia bacterium]